jgi:hypothetical protein
MTSTWGGVAEKGQTVDGCRILSFRVSVGGKFTGQRAPNLNHRRFGITMILKVLGHFVQSSFSGYRQFCNLHASNRIRQKIGRIG